MKNGFEVYQDEKGEWRWRLRATNGQVVADSSEGYVRVEDCEHGIELVKQSGMTAGVRRVAR